jgi:predicted O-methyltransferase YrrM
VRRILGRVFLSAARRALPDAAVTVALDRPTSATNTPRWGHGRPNNPFLEGVLAEHEGTYRETLGLLRRYGNELAAIDRNPRTDSEPSWDNPMMWGLDGAAIYCFLRSRKPRRYVEIGSGWSTKFAARAKRDGGLDTRIVSIDPEPRTEIDALCDEPVRTAFEEAPSSVYENIEPGDVVFLDGSHRVFMNNDVSVFFLDLLPRLDPGVLVGVHDIFLPEDYCPKAAHFYWSELYMMALALLAGRERIRPVLASHYVCKRPDLHALCTETWEAIGLGDIFGYGSTLWFEPDLGLRGS